MPFKLSPAKAEWLGVELMEAVEECETSDADESGVAVGGDLSFVETRHKNERGRPESD